MGSVRKLGLLLWKYFLLRKRSPILLFFEFAWPVIIIVIMIAARFIVQNTFNEECHFSRRVMPSDGVNFLGDFLCNANKSCSNEPVDNPDGIEPNVALLLEQLIPVMHLDAEAIADLLNTLPEKVALLEGLEALMKQPGLSNLLNMPLTLRDLIKDPDELIMDLHQASGLHPASIATIFDAKLNLLKISDLLVGSDALSAVWCDPVLLSEYFTFTDVTPEMVTSQLCPYQSVMTATTSQLTKHIDMGKVFLLLAQVQRLLGEEEAATGMENLGRMLLLLDTSPFINGLFKSLPHLQSVGTFMDNSFKYLATMDPSLMANLPALVVTLDELSPLVEPLMEEETDLSEMRSSLPSIGLFTDMLTTGQIKLKNLAFTLNVDLRAGDAVIDEETMLQFMTTTYGMTRSEAQDILNLNVDLTTAIKTLERLPEGSGSYHVVCLDPGLDRLLLDPSDVSSALLGQMKTLMCEKDLTVLADTMAMLRWRTIFTKLTTEPDEGIVTVDWEHILGDVWTFMNTVGVLDRSLEFLPQNNLNISLIWDAVATSVAQGQDPAAAFASLQPVVSILQAQYQKQDTWPAFRHMLIQADSLLDVLDTALHQIAGVDALSSMLLQGDYGVGSVLQPLVNSDPQFAALLTQSMLGPSTLLPAVELADYSEHYLCNESVVTGNMWPSGPVNTTLLSWLISQQCHTHIRTNLTAFVKQLDSTAVKQKFSDFLNLYTGDAATVGDEWDDKANLNRLLLRLFESGNNLYVLLPQLLSTDTSDNVGIHNATVKLYTAHAIVADMAKVIFKTLEEGSQWPRIAGPLKGLAKIMQAHAMSLDRMPGLRDESTLYIDMVTDSQKSIDFFSELSDALKDDDVRGALGHEMTASSTEAVLCSDQFLEILDVNTENVFWSESLVTAMCPDHMDQAQDHLHTARELNYLSARHQFEARQYFQGTAVDLEAKPENWVTGFVLPTIKVLQNAKHLNRLDVIKHTMSHVNVDSVLLEEAHVKLRDVLQNPPAGLEELYQKLNSSSYVLLATISSLTGYQEFVNMDVDTSHQDYLVDELANVQSITLKFANYLKQLSSEEYGMQLEILKAMRIDDCLALGNPLQSLHTLGEFQMFSQLFEDLVFIPEELGEMTCSMPSSNVTVLGSQLDGSYMTNAVDKILAGTVPDFRCEDLMTSLSLLYSGFWNTMESGSQKWYQSLGCMGSTADNPVPAMMEMDQMLGQLSTVKPLLSNIPSRGAVLTLAPLLDMFMGPLLTDTLDLSSFATNLIPVGDLVGDIDALDIPAFFKPFIPNLLISPELIFLILDGDSVAANNIFCTDDLLLKHMALQNGWNVLELKNILCDNAEIAVLFTSLLGDQDIMVSVVTMVRDMLSVQLTPEQTQMIPSLLSLLDVVVSNIDPALINLAPLFADFTLDNLVNNLPAIIPLLNGDSLDGVGDTFVGVLQALAPFLGDATGGNGTNSLQDDMLLVAEGLKSVAVFKTLLPTDYVEIGSLIADTTALDALLEEQDLALFRGVILSLKISPDLVFLAFGDNGEALNALFCSVDEMKKYIAFEDDSFITPELLKSTMCGNDMSAFFNAVLEGVDITQYILDALPLSIEAITGAMGLDYAEVQELLSKFGPLAESFGEVLDGFVEASQKSDLSGLLGSLASDASGDSDLLSSMTKLLCGREVGLSAAAAAIPDLGVLSRKKRSTDEEYCTELLGGIRESLENGSETTGKIVWKFLNPILAGRVVYTPDNEAAKLIMKRAAYQVLDPLRNLTIFAVALTENADITQNLGAMFQILINILQTDDVAIHGLIQSLTGMSVGELGAQFSGFGGGIGMLDGIIPLAKLLADFLRCFETDRLEAYDTEADMEEAALKWFQEDKLLAGITFLGLDDADPDNLPKHIQYKIRMNIDIVASTKAARFSVWRNGPGLEEPADLRYMLGFIIIQTYIERAVLSLQTNIHLNDIPIPILQPFPWPCWFKDNYKDRVLTYFFPILITLCWLLVMGIAIRNIVYDKEHRLEEMMKMMGMGGGVNWLAWMLNTMLSMIILSLVLTILVRVGQLMVNVNVFLLFLYMLDFSFATMMFSYLVSVFFNRATLAALAGLLLFLVFYMPYIILVYAEDTMNFTDKILMCLASSSAFAYGISMTSRLDISGEGLYFSTADDKSLFAYDDGFTFAWTFYMILIDGVIYGLLAWYIRNVWPGKYGIAQPWYFPVSTTYWGCSSSTRMEDQKASAQVAGESDPADLPAGMSLSNLTKKYGWAKHAAVNNISANIYQDQITAFLGQNGAGKTTTINMVTGLIEPSSGDVYVDGWNIHSDSKMARKSLGVCPQFNVLFDFMTVKEHMELFCSMKSDESREHRNAEVTRMLNLTDLHHCSGVLVGDLSDGQRRRVAVSLAFIGGSRVIILDEPTTGIDPSAKRSIWDLILQHRQGYTVLLSTHHMDEADLLADRVVIIHKGKLVCSGSPMFLKKSYGSGYNLTIAKDISNGGIARDAEPMLVYCWGSIVDAGPTLNQHRLSVACFLGFCMETLAFEPLLYCVETHEALEDFVVNRVPGARLEEAVGTEVTYILPTDQTHGQQTHFQKFFAELDDKKGYLGVSSYGISDTTLEEIFLKVTLQCERGEVINSSLRTMNVRDELNQLKMHDNGHKHTKYAENDGGDISRQRVTGFSHSLQGFRAVLTKRFLHHVRDFRFYLSQFILPCVFVILSMAFIKARPALGDYPAMLLTPDLYKSSFIRSEDTTEAGNSWLRTLGSAPGLGTACMKDSTISADLCDGDPLHGWRTDEHRRTPVYAGSERCHCDEDKDWLCPDVSQYQRVSYSAMQSDHRVYNITGVPTTTDDYILNTFNKFVRNRYGGMSFETNQNETYNTSSTIWYNTKGWHTLPAYYNAFHNMFMRSNVDKTSASDYGVSVYNHPLSFGNDQLGDKIYTEGLADIGISLTILLAFCFVPSGLTVYLMEENTSKEKRLQLLNGLSLSLYWAASFTWDLLCCLLTTLLVTLVAYLFGLNMYVYNINLLGWSFLIFAFLWAALPLSYLISRRYREVTKGYTVIFITLLLMGLATVCIIFLMESYLERQACPPGQLELCASVRNAHSILRRVFLVFPPFCLADGVMRIATNQIQADALLRFGVDSYVSPFDLDALGWNYIALALEGFVYLLLTLILEFRIGSQTSYTEASSQVDEDEEDVEEERKRVYSANGNDYLQLQAVTKVYGGNNTPAVNNLALGVPAGECFGLLGENGAGKSTTFNMMTGELLPTRGQVLIDDTVVRGDSKGLKGEVGYCPQRDALDGWLTAEEHLYCYARIKGIPSRGIPQVVNALLTQLNLHHVAKQKVQSYSGGTRRKLSLALALLGEPQLLLLDEPTTGMDAQSRRLMWDSVIDTVQRGRSVILTSHSLAECEALCTRMAIMVNGKFKCLGSGQHLKTKFGNSHMLSVHVGGYPPNIQAVTDFITDKFSGASVQATHHNMVEYSIPYHTAHLSQIFAALGSQNSLNIDHYSLSQSSLEQVFLGFTRHQTDTREAPIHAYDNNGYDNSAPAKSTLFGSSSKPQDKYMPESQGPNNGPNDYEMS